MSAHSSRASRFGRVTDYLDGRGYGTVSSAEGDHFFHCTAITDGSRGIESGTAVVFVLEPGHLGRWEARDLRPA